MFAYNPQVTDRSGEFIAQGMSNAANLRAQGMQSLGQSIGQGLAGLGGGIGGMIKDSQAKTAKLQGIQSTGSALQAILPQYGQEGMALGQALQTELGKAGNNPDKIAGTMMAFMPAVEGLQSRYNQAAQIEGYKDLADYKSSVGPGTDTTTAPPKLDSNFARQFYQGLRANNRTHEQALADMDNAGLNWGKQYIEGQKSPFFQ
jgi:hypothetical protein